MVDERALEAGDPMAGRSVLVAGATGGLGSAIAQNLARRRAVLTLVSRHRDALAALDVPGHRLALDLARKPTHQLGGRSGLLGGVRD